MTVERLYCYQLILIVNFNQLSRIPAAVVRWKFTASFLFPKLLLDISGLADHHFRVLLLRLNLQGHLFRRTVAECGTIVGPIVGGCGGHLASQAELLVNVRHDLTQELVGVMLLKKSFD